jgi:nitroreductase
MTNPVLEAIASRRSVRGYAEEQITKEQREALVTAALQSPSAVDRQPWHFSVVQDRALLEKINEAAHDHAVKDLGSYAAALFGRPGYHVFFGAPTVFFISLDKDAPNGQYVDAGIAAENIVLAAMGLGLGSVILGMPREAFFSDQGDGFRKALDFPENYDFAIAVAVGRGTVTKPAHEFKPGRVSFIG